ncbi:MAG: hypothetical protein HC895_02955 [Leptolyngbyaceae cyanobacterium SM1_3_5]|nr:hypothetical protein [Leptolyngbyaceae cyanobacterium SM1_3_5]
MSVKQVDALLAIDPTQFKGCDLIVDEVVQVLRHLLTSSTCNRDGMRPLLLARFAQLVRSARRVIVADADLDNATLHYLQQLRGEEDNSVFLIRNDYQPQGYAVYSIDSPDSSALIAQLLSALNNLPPGKVLFVTTDSLQKSKHLAHVIGQQCPGKRVLVINSHTSSGQSEQAFIKNPDPELANYDVVIATPSLGTGVSIEAQGVIESVYGIFTGGSSTDADIAQALSRVREPVDRILWCAKRGTNFSKVSRSPNAIELKRHLQEQTSVAASLVKLSLSDTTQSRIEAYDWQSDVHLNLWSHFTAAQNRSMLDLRDALLVRLRQEGHCVTIEAVESHAAMKLLLKATSEELKLIDAEAIANAEARTHAEVKLLEAKESRTAEENREIASFYLREFYGLDTLTIEDVLADRNGRHRGELLNLEAQLQPETALDRTAKALEKQANWNQGLCPWDISGAMLRQAMREQIGLPVYLDPDREWTKYDLAAQAAIARRYVDEIKQLFHLTIKPEMSDVQIVHQLLSQMGVKVAFRWSRRVAGHEGEKLRVYRLDADRWQAAIDILERRRARRERLAPSSADAAETGSSPRLIPQNQLGDPPPQTAETAQNSDAWLTPDSLADVRSMWESAASEEERAELRQSIPAYVLKRAIA